jgi:hypothetical protein
MKFSRRLAAAIAVPALALGAGLAASGTAHAAGGYADTSLQATYVAQHTVAGTASAAGTSEVVVSGLLGDEGGFGPATSRHVTWAVEAGSPLDGVAVSATTLASGPVSDAVLTAVGHPSTGGANTHGNIVLTATDTDGDVAVVTVPVVVAVNSVSYDTSSAGVLTDEIKTVTDVNQNGPGSVLFSATDNLNAAVAIGETNLPAGLVSGDPLEPGTAVPGTYNDLAVQATDINGATATGAFLLKVNGGPAPVAPVPVLSHGSATYVAATRENVSFDTTITTWVHFQIAGPGAINGHQGWVHAVAGELNTGVYTGLEANHTYAVYYTPVEGQGSTVQIVGTRTGHVTFISNRP